MTAVERFEAAVAARKAGLSALVVSVSLAAFTKRNLCRSRR